MTHPGLGCALYEGCVQGAALLIYCVQNIELKSKVCERPIVQFNPR